MASLGLFPLLGLCGAVPGWACPSPQRGAAAPEDPLRFLGSPTQERKAVGPSDLLGGTVCRGGGLASLSICLRLPPPARAGANLVGRPVLPWWKEAHQAGIPSTGTGSHRLRGDSPATAQQYRQPPTEPGPCRVPFCSLLPPAVPLAPPAHCGSVPTLPLAALVSPLLSTLASPGFCSRPTALELEASASSALIQRGLSAACGLAWLGREVGASSCRVLALPRPVSPQRLPPSVTVAGQSLGGGPIPGVGAAQLGRAAGGRGWEPAGPGAVGLGRVCSGRPGRSCQCPHGARPRASNSFTSGLQRWCADLGNGGPHRAVNHCQRPRQGRSSPKGGALRAGPVLSPGAGPSKQGDSWAFGTWLPLPWHPGRWALLPEAPEESASVWSCRAGQASSHPRLDPAAKLLGDGEEDPPRALTHPPQRSPTPHCAPGLSANIPFGRVPPGSPQAVILSGAVRVQVTPACLDPKDSDFQAGGRVGVGGILWVVWGSTSGGVPSPGEVAVAEAEAQSGEGSSPGQQE